MLDRLATALHLGELGVLALVDILLLALIIYQLLLLVRGTRSMNMLVALVTLLLFYLLSAPGMIHLRALHNMLGKLLLFLPLAVIVLFQTQIRQALANLGKNPFSLFTSNHLEDDRIQAIALAAASLASKRIGALIVIEREMGLRTFCETGIELEAKISYDLLMNLFTRNSPLHDGAVIVGENKIKAASCFLPLTTKASLSRSHGTRHRAAIGITEESDALAVVVSEERGIVSLAKNGKIKEQLSAEALADLLHRELAPRDEKSRSRAARQDVFAAGPSDA